MPWTDIEGYRFGFWSVDCSEPPHVHVFRGGSEVKIWLRPIELEWNRGYNQRELNRILELTSENRQGLLEMWNEHCG